MRLLIAIQGERSNTFCPSFVNIGVYYYKHIPGLDTTGPFWEKVHNNVMSMLTSVTVPRTVRAGSYCMGSYMIKILYTTRIQK